jgi:hypothetical protein
MAKKFKGRKSSSYNRQSRNLPDKSGKREPLIVFSYKDFDRSQGQSFKEWETDELLATLTEKLLAISGLTVAQVIHQKIIKVYSKVDFPPNSDFTHPKHVPEDIKWCSMHIQGKECVIGYFEDNIFQIVFLDKEHQFWKTKKKNT